ncbi:MAG TPA: thioredoxin family protein [Pseudonocardiaceae bacterium]|nr:thioredoxin family protein [Pseudonocardiaceae bacterium]
MPALLVMRDGEVIAQQVGATPLPALRSWLNEAISTADTRNAAAST